MLFNIFRYSAFHYSNYSGCLQVFLERAFEMERGILTLVNESIKSWTKFAPRAFDGQRWAQLNELEKLTQKTSIDETFIVR